MRNIIQARHKTALVGRATMGYRAIDEQDADTQCSDQQSWLTALVHQWLVIGRFIAWAEPTSRS